MSTTRKIYEEINDAELTSIAGAIKNRYGIDFTSYEKKSLKRGFARLMGKHGMESLIDLWKVILNDRSFFKSAIDDLTVNLTELFRNPEIWGLLDHDILERFTDKRVVRIWHAGCSTGEEVYSMRMVLDRKGMLGRTETLATDLSSRALEKAEKGLYSRQLVSKYEKSLQRYMPSGQMSDLFDIENGHAVIKDRFRRGVDFRQHNLVSDSMPSGYDIIFCRNVMIYFDDVLKLRVLERLLSSLNPDGFIVLGYYDMLPEQSRSMIEQYDSKTRIYVPRGTGLEKPSYSGDSGKLAVA